MFKNDRVVVAVPKGLLYEDACARLRDAGIAIPRDPGRKLRLSVPGGNGELLIVRPADIPVYVASGAADCGIVGNDTLWESEASVEELADLEFGGCRLVVAARRIDGYHEGVRFPKTVRVATRFVRTARAYFAQRDLSCEIVQLHGSVELGPLVGLSDVVVDLVSTGRTLQENDMVIVDEIDRSSARFVASPTLLPDRYQLVRSLLDRLMVADAVYIVAASDADAMASVYRRGWSVSNDISQRVKAILAEVRERGDEALVEHVRRFSAPSFDATLLRVAIPEPESARSLVSDAVASGLALMFERTRRFHERQRPADIDYIESDGTLYGFHYRPLKAVAAYVPAGSAPLVSSVMMNVVPAKVAGVARTIVLSPPRADGRIDPAIIYACALCGVDELYAVGGAHAIAAAAFGTPSIAPVDKIVGPGNVWVTEAKRQVFGTCAIDGLAGPSEVLVVADENASVRNIAWELLAQAEHDPLARVAVVSESERVLSDCIRYLEQLDVRTLERGDIIEAAFSNGLSCIQASNRQEIFEVIERFAPEHLSLQVARPQEYLPRITTAGAIFIGSHSPVACGDYTAGTNHVLPTCGSARFASGLRTLDFMRSFSLLSNSLERITQDAPVLAELAAFEGLAAHAQSALMRAQPENAAVRAS